MSGIVGVYHRGQDRDTPERLIRNMVSVIRHRGPDSESVTVGKKAAFGHCGSRTGDFFAKSKDVVVCLDGAIYNASELRRDLESRHQLQGDSIGEIISRLYEEIGVDCVNRLRGMFAIALYDRKSESLFLARDRLGEKPLVYAEIAGSIYFASEIKSLLEVPGIDREIDLEGLHHYFSYQTYIPAPYTIFHKIKKLAPATYLFATREVTQLKSYWKIDYHKELTAPLQDCCEEYLRLLNEIVKMQTDKIDPVGVSLSGGVDSSSIVAVLSKQATSPVKTFSIGREPTDTKDPEFGRALQVARLCGTEHHEVTYHSGMIRIQAATTMDYFGGDLVNQFAALYTRPLVEAMAKEVPVILCGNGPDEEFGGYTGYTMWRRFDVARRIAKLVVPRPLLNLSSTIGGRAFGPTNIGAAFQLMKELPLSQLQANDISAFGRTISQNLYSPAFLEAIKDVEIGKLVGDTLTEAHTSTILESRMHVDLMLKNLSVIVAWEALGANSSLEIRTPFLDHRMVEFAASLPIKYKVPSLFKPQLNKLIMKKALQGMLPTDTLFSRKMGFGYGIRWVDWLETRWSDAVRKLLLGGGLRDSGLFRMEYVDSLFDKRTMDRPSWATLVWGLVNFEIWYQIYIQGKNPGEIDVPFD